MSLKKLIMTKKTVFSITDLEKIFLIENKKYLLVYLNRLNKRGDLIRIKKGIYSLTKDYNRLELANKLKIPSYVSLQTVLFQKGIIFQDFSNIITSVSNNTKKFLINGCEYRYHKIKDEVLTNPYGIVVEDQVRIASLERAICDFFYLYKETHLDNIKPIDKKKLLSIAKIYGDDFFNKLKKYVKQK